MSAPLSRKPVKVLEVLEATVGGTRRHLVDIVTNLNPARCKVSVACSTRRDPSFVNDIAFLTAKGIQVTVIPMQRAINPVGDLLALVRLFRLMRRGGFDVVHTHSSKAGFIGRLAARMARVPRIIHTAHTFPFQMDSPPLLRFIYVQLERFAARFTDRLVCVCPSQKPIAETLIDPARVVVIENGIGQPTSSADQYGGHYAARRTPDEGPPVLLPHQARTQQRRELGVKPGNLVVGVIGRFTRQKGHSYFIEAARRVAARQPAARFLLVGDGELRETIERQITAAGLQSRCLLVGAREDVPELLPVFDVVVLPSLWEGLPYVLLEAMAAGKAVVATRVGGMPDVIQEGQSGLLVPPADSAALAAALVKVLENEELRSKMGNSAREVLRHRCHIEEMIGQLTRMYEGT
jgi:glycosyltransferase involved in cell wall biosynthesis